MKNKEKSEPLRMYFFVLYSLSGIQKGIQAGHAALEYANKFHSCEKYKEFVNKHKTFILLDGGTSETMKHRMNELEELNIKFAGFIEPDLNYSISALAFVLSESEYKVVDDVDFETNAIADYLRNFRLASN